MAICRLFLLLSMGLCVTGLRFDLYHYLLTLARDSPVQRCKTGACLNPVEYQALAYILYKGLFTQEMRQQALQRLEKQRQSLAYRFYEGLFHTTQEIRQQAPQRSDEQRQLGNRSQTYWRRSSATDYDQCCPTNLSSRTPTHLMNVRNDLRSVAQLDRLDPPAYQRLYEAECGPEGSCIGTCRLQMVPVTLLVHVVGNLLDEFPFEFDTFHVAGYCSCKSP